MDMEKDVGEIQYLTHEDPAGRGFRNYIANVDLAPFGFPGLMEQVWLEPLESGHFRFQCIPFRIYGVALLDEVSVDPRHQVSALLSASGHRVRRALLPDVGDAEASKERISSISAAVHSRGLTCEWSGDRHLAIDVPPGKVGTLEDIEQVIRMGVHIEGPQYWEWADAKPFQT
jgi:hypothetical protein